MLGDLNKLIEQGYITDKYIYDAPTGSYEFVLKTLSPIDEVECFKAIEKFEMDQEKTINLTIEFLARSIESVNGVALEQVPGAEGQTSLDKKRSTLKKLSGKMILGLWAKYQSLSESTTPTGSQEELEEIKK